jgi:hypothetical protein
VSVGPFRFAGGGVATPWRPANGGTGRDTVRPGHNPTGPLIPDNRCFVTIIVVAPARQPYDRSGPAAPVPRALLGASGSLPGCCPGEGVFVASPESPATPAITRGERTGNALLRVASQVRRLGWELRQPVTYRGSVGCASSPAVFESRGVETDF